MSFRRNTGRPARAQAAILAGLCVLLFAAAASAQTTVGRPGSQIEADSFIERAVEGERISYGYGNVFIDRDTLKAWCDTALYYRTRGEYEFFGNVRIIQHESELLCRRGVYRMDDGEGDFFGDVRVQDGEMTVTGLRGESRDDGRLLRMIGDALLVTPEYSVRADTVQRDRITGEGEAFGRVRIMEPGANSLVTGEHAVFEADGEVAVIDRDPYLVSRQQGGGPLIADSELMRFYRAEDRVVMIDSVAIHHDQTRAWADTAVAYGRERLVLSGTPRVSMDGDQSFMYGRTIDFRYREGQLREVILVGGARMEDAAPDSLAGLYGGLPAMDVLEGDSITVYFRDNVVSKSVVVGAAHSIYTPLDLVGEVATNDVVGDTIVIDFRAGKVDRVTVIGQMSGRYRFAKIAQMETQAGRRQREADRLARIAADSLAAGVDSLVLADGDTLETAGEEEEVAAPTEAPRDSLALAPPDSLSAPADTPAAVPDSLGLILAAPGAMDFDESAQDVDYAGGRLEFQMRDRAIDISEPGKLVYGTMTLTAQHIRMDTDERELYAEGDPLVEDSDLIAGQQMGYNFGAKTGAVEGGVTAMDDYYYSGDEIRRFPDTTMKICSGRMTSCDLEKPHYHFWADRMKLRMEDKIVAAPIVLRVGEVPIFALPFFFRNLKEGRRSGILFPSFDFGFSSREGRYIRDFGYYWATNDYTDFLVEGDYNERDDIAFRIQNRYKKRYTMDGSVDYSWRNGLGGDNLRQWQLRWRHKQPNLLDDYSFTADVKLASSKLTTDDLENAWRRDIISNQRLSTFYISRNFEKVSTSLNIKRDERANAEDDDPATNELRSNTTLPNLTLNFRQFSLAPQLRSGQRGSFAGDLLRNTTFKHSYSFQSDREVRERTTEKDYDATGNWSLALRPPRVGIFNFNFSASAKQNWHRNELTGRDWNAGTDSTEGYYTSADTTWEETTPSAGFGGGVNTTLYGVFPVPVGKLRAIRHTFKAESSWRQTVGLNGRRASSSVGLSVSNRVDAKYLTADSDSTQTTKKLDGLLDWSLSTNYRPQNDPDDRWDNISSRMTVKPGQNRYLKLTVQNTIDPYSLSLLSTRFSYNVSLNFKGRLDVGDVPKVEEAKRSEVIERLGPLPGQAEADSLAALADSLEADPWADPDDPDDPYGEYWDDYGTNDDWTQQDQRTETGLGGGRDTTEGGRFLPFEIRPTVNYNYSTSTADRHRATSTLNAKAQLTKNWEFTYSAAFDLVESAITRQSFSLNRDLHCWRLEFNRTVSSVDSRFGFRIYLKSIPALKFTRGREDQMGSLSSGAGLY